MNFAAHAFDKVLSIMDGAKIISADGQCGNLTRDYDVEGHAQIFAKFDNGVSGCITLSGYSATGYQTYFHFTKGSIRTNGSKMEINRGDGNGFVSHEFTPAKITGFTEELDAFYRYVNDQPSNIPDGEYSKQIVDAIQTAYTKSI